MKARAHARARGYWSGEVRLTRQKAITYLIIIVGGLVYFYYSGMIIPITNPDWNYISASEGFDAAATYVLTGEPYARLYRITLSGSWRSGESTNGKSSSWEYEFCAPDGAKIEVEATPYTRSGFPPELGVKVYLCYPWDGPASEKESYELWQEERESGHLYPSLYEDCIEEWVDSTEVFTDALERARKVLGDV